MCVGEGSIVCVCVCRGRQYCVCVCVGEGSIVGLRQRAQCYSLTEQLLSAVCLFSRGVARPVSSAPICTTANVPLLMYHC